jgi:hypothetical protein
MCHTPSPTDDQHLDCECNRTTIDVHRGSQGIELALDAAQVAATRGNLTCRLGLTFRKSSPRIKQHPAEKRNQHPSCVYFGSSRNVLWVAVHSKAPLLFSPFAVSMGCVIVSPSRSALAWPSKASHFEIRDCTREWYKSRRSVSPSLSV